MYELRTDIEIAAAPEEIWSILIDFAAYPRWNPFIRHILGVAEQGSALEVCMHPAGARGARFRPTVLVVDPPRELRWRGRLLVPGVLDDEHCFLIEPLSDGRVRFEQSERFSGLLTPLAQDRIERNLARGFREMNAALKGRVERTCSGAEQHI